MAGRVIRRLRELPVLFWTNISSIVPGVVGTAMPTMASPAIASLARFRMAPAWWHGKP